MNVNNIFYKINIWSENKIYKILTSSETNKNTNATCLADILIKCAPLFYLSFLTKKVFAKKYFLIIPTPDLKNVLLIDNKLFESNLLENNSLPDECGIKNPKCVLIKTRWENTHEISYFLLMQGIIEKKLLDKSQIFSVEEFSDLYSDNQELSTLLLRIKTNSNYYFNLFNQKFQIEYECK